MSLRARFLPVFAALLVWPAAHAVELAHVYEDGGVLLYEGSRAGIKEGQILTIVRGKDAVGQVQIDEVTDFTARGRAIKGDVTQGDTVATEEASLQETPVPFMSAGDTPRTPPPAPGGVSLGGMKRKDAPADDKMPTERIGFDDEGLVTAKALDADLPDIPLVSSPTLAKPSVVALLDGGKPHIPLPGLAKPKAGDGSLGLVTRPSAVVFKPKGGTVGVKYGYNSTNQHTRNVYTGRYAPSEKLELYLESTDSDVNRQSLARYGGKMVVANPRSGAQAALYANVDTGDAGGTEYGVVGTWPNAAGRFTLGAYLGQGGATKLQKGRKVKLGEDYGFYLGLERNLILGLSLALEYDTVAFSEGGGYGAELRWKRGPNYSLTASVQDVNSFRDATLGAFFSF